jgi:hydrocephalus-inducing protein
MQLQPGESRSVSVGFAPSARVVAARRAETLAAAGAATGGSSSGRKSSPRAPAKAPAKGKAAAAETKVEDTPDFESTLTMSVLYNQFETTVLKLVGRSFMDDLAFDNLPNDSQDSVVFGDMDISDAAGQQVGFTLINQSEAVLRYSLPSHKDFSLSPAVGFIPPRGSKDVVLTFLPPEPVSHVNLPLPIAFQRVTLSGEPTLPLWDSSAKAPVDEDGAGGAPLPEPGFTPAGEPKTTALNVSAVAENVTYVCDAKDLALRPTMLFQTRVHRFTLTNPTRARLEYRWSLEDVNPVPLPPSSARGAGAKRAPPPVATQAPFVIEPAVGTVPPNGSTTFTLRFSPLEVHDYRYKASANILLLSPTVEPLVRGIAS